MLHVFYAYRPSELMHQRGFPDKKRTWLHRDEGQQAGMPVVSRHSAHIRPSAFEMWIGDLMQPVGGVNKEQEEVGILIQKKRCALRMLTGKPLQPREVKGFLESHILEPKICQVKPNCNLPEAVRLPLCQTFAHPSSLHCAAAATSN